MTSNPSETRTAAKRAVVITLSVVGTLFVVALLGVGGLKLWDKATAETAGERFSREHAPEIQALNAKFKAKLDSAEKADARDSAARDAQARR